MASVTLNISKELKTDLENLNWVNWSSFARLDLRKKKIFESYLKTKELSDKDWKFCEEIDWHPVDELPLREGFTKELRKTEKGPHNKMTLKELDKLLGIK